MKYFERGFFIFNFISGIVGFNLTGFGTYYFVSVGINDGQYLKVIGCGLLIVLGFIFGCCGFYTKSVFFMSCNILIFVIPSIPIIYDLGRLYSTDVEMGFLSQIGNAWGNRYWQPELMASYQRQFQCCGILSYKDYLGNNELVPSSCYAPGDENEGKLNEIGCYQKLRELANVQNRQSKITLWCLTAFLGCFLTCAVLLAKHFHKTNESSPKTSNNKLMTF